MSKTAANGMHIEYETVGDPAARPLLLIGGLADQLIHWDDASARTSHKGSLRHPVR